MAKPTYFGGAPGQREFRQSKWKDERQRILDCVMWMCLFALGILVLLFADSLILGPWVGWTVALLFVSWLLVHYIVGPTFKNNPAPGPRLVIGLSFTALLVCWAWFGYPWVKSLWPPFYISVQKFLPVWVSTLSLNASLFVKIALAWGVWAMFTEMVDPNGPTSPRSATAREKTIYPWDKDTFGGRVTPEPVPPAVLPQPVTRVQVTTADGRHMQETLMPSSSKWKAFSAFVVANHDNKQPPDKLGFTEFEARRRGVKLNAKMDENGTVLVPSFKTVREHFLALNWAHWKNPQAHNQGVLLHEQAIAALRGAASGLM